MIGVAMRRVVIDNADGERFVIDPDAAARGDGKPAVRIEVGLTDTPTPEMVVYDACVADLSRIIPVLNAARGHLRRQEAAQ